MQREHSCWLVKSEPDCFSIHDLAKCPGKTTSWSGVRNYQARNFMRDGMKLGDRVLFFHSSADPPAAAGTAIVAREAYPDHTAWEKADDHFDPKASPDNPLWQMVDIRLEEIFDEPVPIGQLREVAALRNMVLLQKGSRLSVQPVTPSEFEAVLKLAHTSPKAATPKNSSSKKTPAKKTPIKKAAKSSAAKRPARSKAK